MREISRPDSHRRRISLCRNLARKRGLCGGVGLRPAAQHQHAELGYWIGVPYWAMAMRRGYARVAALRIENLGFIASSHRISRTICVGANPEKARHAVEGCQREHLCKWDQFIDLELYGLLRQEWEHSE